MAWSPDPSFPLHNADELLVLVEFSQSFSYSSGIEGDLETYSITSIVAPDKDSGITIGSDNISGSYSGDAHGGLSVVYMDKNYDYQTVDAFEDITNSWEICKYNPPTQQLASYEYIVTATGSLGTIVTATYNDISTFNWTAGKVALQAAVAETRVGRD